MATVTESITLLCSEASTAIAAVNYAIAQSKLLQAEALLIGLPNQTKEGDAVAWNNSRITIDSLLTNLRKLQNTSTGIQRCPTTYVRG